MLPTKSLVISASDTGETGPAQVDAAGQSADSAPSIGDKARNGSVWIIASTSLAKAFGFACQLALAYYLTKQEFGVYAIAVSLAVLLSIMRDGGLLMVLEHKGREFDSFAGPVFWMMLGVNCATGLLIASIARPAAGYYAIPELRDVILLFAITVPTSGLPAVLNVRMGVNLQFRELGMIQVTSAIIRNGLLLLFARHGFGAKSFLLPLLVTNLTDTLMLWLVSRFTPWTRPPQFHVWPELFRQGRWVLLGTFAIAFGNSGAYFFLGKILPSDVLGTYFFAYQMVIQLGMLLADNVYQVLFAAFVRMDSDMERIRAAVPRALYVLVLVGSSASLSIAAVFSPLEHILWHGKWAGAAHAIDVLAFVWPAAAATSVMRALQASTGRFHQWGLIALLSSFISVCGTVVGAYIGRSATGAAIGFGVSTLLCTTIISGVALGSIGLGTTTALGAARAWMTLAAASAAAQLLGRGVHTLWLELLVTATLFGLMGFLALKFCANESLQLLRGAVSQVLRGRLRRESVTIVEL